MMSDRAATAMDRMVKEQNLGKVYLRVGVKGGGCSGFSYILDFDKHKAELDEVFIKEWVPEDIEVICDPKSLLYLTNTIIDFKDSLVGGGFTFVNPNAATTCGCGESFSA